MPLAIFASVAKSASENTRGLLPGLGAYLALCLSGMALQTFLVYPFWIRIMAKIRLKDFWRESREAILHAFGINSSLATLPLTLSSLDRMRVSPAAARLSACVGTNFNNDGILLYEVAATLFLAQAHGVQLSPFQTLGVAGICVASTLGVAGIPEAGIISLTLVLSATGIPAESLPLLLTVDWLIARCRSAVNVTSDLTVAIGIDALTRPKNERKTFRKVAGG
jgi:DAACS family dicarboxylate/amino acid:cation (Na+ or H+) symporter